jgi:hypothetical protein
MMTTQIGKGADRSALSRSIDPDWIIRALSSTGKASVRRRKLPAEHVVWLVIALALYRHQSIPDVVAHLALVLPDEVNPDIARGALTQARQRLGDEPLAQLFAISSAVRDEQHQSGRAWRAMRRTAARCERPTAPRTASISALRPMSTASWRAIRKSGL